MRSLKSIVDRGLEQTAELWPEVQQGFAWVHHAAAILKNESQHSGKGVRQAYRRHLQQMAWNAPASGALRQAVEHFLKVTHSYWPGLFACYRVADLPRTNNGLEQLFGSTRHHERRCTGRKVASPSLVLRGAVRIVAGVGTRQRAYCGEELAPANPGRWQRLRAELEGRREARVLRCRFRRHPAAYLHSLEKMLLKSALPT